MLTAGIVGLFLGGLGIHNFIVKRVGRGLIELFLTIIATGGLPITFIAMFADAFRCGTGTMCPSGFNYDILFLIFGAIIAIVGIVAFVESIILIATHGKYPPKPIKQ